MTAITKIKTKRKSKPKTTTDKFFNKLREINGKLQKSKIFYYILLMLFIVVTATGVKDTFIDLRKIKLELKQLIPQDQQANFFEKIKIILKIATSNTFKTIFFTVNLNILLFRLYTLLNDLYNVELFDNKKLSSKLIDHTIFKLSNKIASKTTGISKLSIEVPISLVIQLSLHKIKDYLHLKIAI